MFPKQRPEGATLHLRHNNDTNNNNNNNEKPRSESNRRPNVKSHNDVDTGLSNAYQKFCDRVFFLFVLPALRFSSPYVKFSLTAGLVLKKVKTCQPRGRPNEWDVRECHGRVANANANVRCLCYDSRPGRWSLLRASPDSLWPTPSGRRPCWRVTKRVNVRQRPRSNARAFCVVWLTNAPRCR